MNRPKELYHASTVVDVEVFEPRNEYPRYPGEPNLVFATPHKALAAMFLAPDDFAKEIAVYGDRYVIFINGTEENHKAADRAGAIYTLPVETFETDASRGMGEVEWYSEVAVRPISKMVYKSSIEAMDELGVERYYVNDEVFRKIQANPADALSLV